MKQAGDIARENTMNNVKREPEVIDIICRIFSKVSSIDNKIPLPESGEDQYPKKVLVLILSIFGIIGGVSLIGEVTSYFGEGLYYSIGFEEGISTYSSDEHFPLIMQEHGLSLYGFEGRPVTLSPKELTGETGDEIGSESIIFRRVTPVTDQPVIFSVDVQLNPFLRGIFTG
ncbi:MAG: hypothetical protein WA941_10255 [Nitrososphaeraceae archaeon]